MSRERKVFPVMVLFVVICMLAVIALFAYGMVKRQSDGVAMSIGTGASVNTATIGCQSNDVALQRVSGEAEIVSAADAMNNWYLKTGKGEIEGTVKHLDDLDANTLSICVDYFKFTGTVDGENLFHEWESEYLVICEGYDPVTGGSRRTENTVKVLIR